MYLLCSLNLKDMPATYGDIALQILKKICIAPRIDFVCDTYRCPSIKTTKQKKHEASKLDITITGPNQKRPKDLKQALTSSKFKSELLSFLTTEWSKDKYAEVLQGHDLYVSCGMEFFRYTSNNGAVIRSSIDSLRNEHEETDTRIILHLMHATSLNPDSVAAVSCSDTDVLFILCYLMKRLSAKVYMDSSYDADSTRKYIDVTKLTREIGNMSNLLPALHAFLGCDYTCSFMRKGKVKFYEKIEKSDEYQDLFKEYGQLAVPSENMLNGMQKLYAIYMERQRCQRSVMLDMPHSERSMLPIASPKH